MQEGVYESQRCCGIQLSNFALDYPFYGDKSTHTESYRHLSVSLRRDEIIFQNISYIDKQQVERTPASSIQKLGGFDRG